MGIFNREGSFNRNNSKNNIEKNNNNLYEIFINLIDKITKKISIEEIFNIYEKNIDQIIIKATKSEKLKYISGSFEMLKNDTDIIIKVDLYFQNAEKKWIKKQSSNKIELFKITDESLEKLENNKVITMEIIEPNNII